MLAAFFPMAFIAAAYYYMNRADPDCGTTFAWMTRAMGPWFGWQGGWAIVVADVLVMPSLASVAGNYTFQLFGNSNPTNFEVTVVGIAWIIIMTAICYIGIELSARTQQVLLGDGVRDADPVRGRRADQGLREPPAAFGRARAVMVQPVRHLEPQRAERRNPAGGIRVLGLGLGRERERGDGGLEHRARPGRRSSRRSSSSVSTCW